MTTSATGRKLTDACNGVTTTFANPKLRGAGDLKVYLLDAATDANKDGVLLTPDIDYTLAADLSAITTAIAQPAGKFIRRWRETSREQTVEIKPNQAVPAATQEDALDRLSLIDEEHDDDLSRALLVPPGAVAPTVPAPEAMKGMFLGGDADGNLVPLSGTGNDSAFRTDVAANGGAALVGTADGVSLQTHLTAILAFVANLGAAGAIAASFAAPAFTNAAYASSAQFNTAGATPGTWYSDQQVGANATEALTAAITVPAAATNHQTSAGAFYIRSDRAQPGIGGDVAIYGHAIANANNSAVFAVNLLMADTAGKTGQTLNNEFDFNISVPGTTVTGLNLVLVDKTGGLLTGFRNALRIDKAFGVNGWLNGLVTVDGAIDANGFAVQVGAQTATLGTNRDSAKIALISFDNLNNRYIATIFGDHTGGLVLRPGSAGGAVAFQDPSGTANWDFVDAKGLHAPGVTLTEVAAGTVDLPGAGTQVLFIDSADSKLKRKTNAGAVTIIG